MTRQLEQEIEEKAAKNRKEVLAAIYGGLDSSLQSEGHELVGFSVRLEAGDCLITLRAHNGKGQMVAFVGAGDLPDALRKAVREAKGGGLNWRPDKYAAK
jgi:hypothetical protein